MGSPEINQLTVYPNPMQDILHVALDAPFTGIILDATGKLVLSITTKEIDTSTLSAGTYIIQIVSEKKQYFTKIIKL